MGCLVRRPTSSRRDSAAAASLAAGGCASNSNSSTANCFSTCGGNRASIPAPANGIRRRSTARAASTSARPAASEHWRGGHPAGTFHAVGFRPSGIPARYAEDVVAAKKKWSDLSKRARKLIIVGAVFEGSLKMAALIDIKRRPASQIRGSKWIWAAVVVLVNSFGGAPLSYFFFGRRRQPGSQPD